MNDRRKKAAGRIVTVISLLLIVGIVLFGTLVVRDFNAALEPELAKRAALIGETIRDDAERALQLGIPLTELVGMEAYFDVLLEDFRELDYLAIRDGFGDIVHSSGAVPDEVQGPGVDIPWSGASDLGGSLVSRFTLLTDGAIVGSVDVGVDSRFVGSKLEDLGLDIVVILIVALVVAYELTLAVGRRISGPREGTGKRGLLPDGGADVRLVLFLFVVGEELSKSFLPQFILSADNPFPSLDPAVAVSLPIMAFLLTLAIASPFADRLVLGFGHRGLFLIGIAAAATSDLGMVFATDLVQIIGLRALTGVGYAFATIACLEYLLDRLPDRSRARTVGVFVAVVIGGTFAGTALGGILADRLGYRPVFAISMALVLVAGVLAWRLMRHVSRSDSRQLVAFSRADVWAVLRHPKLVALLAGVTIPMNVLMAAFLWYLVPLTLAAAGSGAAEIGRTLMLYYLVILVGGPAVARLGDTHVRPWLLVGLGSLLSGVVLLLPAMRDTALAVTVAVVVVGIGHAAVRGPQIAFALDIAESELDDGGRGATLAAMRSLERLGSLAGLLLVALLAARFDLLIAMGVIGVLVAIAAIGFLAVYPYLSRRAVHG